VATAGSTLFRAKAESDSLKAQADSDQQRAAIDAEWDKRRSNEERAAAQSQVGNEQRSARLAQSRLGAVAGASGSGASDPTVMKLWEGIGAEGQRNADMAMVAGEQKATGIAYQSALNRWTADRNAAVKRAGAKSTMIGGAMSATGQLLTPMAQRYAMPARAGGATGYDPTSTYDPRRWSMTSTRYG
jgi:hypothetical protein